MTDFDDIICQLAVKSQSDHLTRDILDVLKYSQSTENKGVNRFRGGVWLSGAKRLGTCIHGTARMNSQRLEAGSQAQDRREIED